jgi:HIV-1 Vpr-binding protein
LEEIFFGFYLFFFFQLVNDYLRDTYYSRLGVTGKDVRKLNIAACRLMLDITPGLETAAVFEMVI